MIGRRQSLSLQPTAVTRGRSTDLGRWGGGGDGRGGRPQERADSRTHLLQSARRAVRRHAVLFRSSSRRRLVRRCVGGGRRRLRRGAAGKAVPLRARPAPLSTGGRPGRSRPSPPRYQSRPVNTRRLRLRLVFQPAAGRPAGWQSV